MLIHPDVLLTMVNDRHHELVAEAEKRHLLHGAHEARETRRARKAKAVRGQPTGSLASCEPSAAVPAR